MTALVLRLHHFAKINEGSEGLTLPKESFHHYTILKIWNAYLQWTLSTEKRNKPTNEFYLFIFDTCFSFQAFGRTYPATGLPSHLTSVSLKSDLSDIYTQGTDYTLGNSSSPKVQGRLQSDASTFCTKMGEATWSEAYLYTARIDDLFNSSSFLL